jgi:hypothetical protein
VIDSNPSSVIRVVRTVDGSTAQPIAGTAERFEAIRSLGYSPADVLLAPCAIWVEGPSDRIYLNAWLGASGLIEGVDYQVMFYGGSLGSHLSTEMEPPNNMLAAIRALSRRCIIVADSDRKTSPRERLKPHVRRWRDEVKGDRNALLWITPGREIENVLPLETINAYRGSKKRRLMTEQTRRFGGVFDGITRPTKVELAALVVSQDPEPPTEIQADVARMVRFVVESRDRGGAA